MGFVSVPVEPLREERTDVLQLRMPSYVSCQNGLFSVAGLRGLSLPLSVDLSDRAGVYRIWCSHEYYLGLKLYPGFPVQEEMGSLLLHSFVPVLGTHAFTIVSATEDVQANLSPPPIGILF